MSLFDAAGKPVRVPGGYGYEYAVDESKLTVAPGLASGFRSTSTGGSAPRGSRRQKFPELRTCYDAGAKTNPALDGTIRTHFEIEEDGTTKGARAMETGFPDRGVVACVVKSFSTLTFPTRGVGGEVTIVYPIHFGP
jgi:hypothetical protein